MCCFPWHRSGGEGQLHLRQADRLAVADTFGGALSGLSPAGLGVSLELFPSAPLLVLGQVVPPAEGRRGWQGRVDTMNVEDRLPTLCC